MTYRALDSIYPENLPGGADAYLAYADGYWPTAAAVRAKFPNAHVVVLAVAAVTNAEGCDAEPRDLTAAQVPGWAGRQLARGVWRPVVYCPASWSAAIIAALASAGIGRDQVRLLSAHYGRGKHICAPAACGYPAADGTQWRDTAPGVGGSLVDESLLADGFFAQAEPKPPPEDDGMQPFLIFDRTEQDGITPVAIPNGYKRLRLFASKPATVDIDLMDGQPMRRRELGYAQRAQGVEVVADCAVVHRVDGGTNPVSCVLTR